MMYMYIRSFTLLAVLLVGSTIHCMDNASQIQEQANQDLLNAASSGNCAGIRNALHRGAKLNCFGIAKIPVNPVAPTTAPAAPTVTEAVSLLVTSALPATPATITPPQVSICPTIECTPIHLAAKHGHYDAVKILLEAGADAQLATRKNTTTPLHAVIQGNNKRDVKTVSETRTTIATLLIKHGASLYTKDFAGKTALDYLHPSEQASTNAKQAITNKYRWKQGTYYGTWVCGTLIVGLICVGIQHAYNKYYRNRHNNLDEDIDKTKEPRTDNGANHEKQ